LNESSEFGKYLHVSQHLQGPEAFKNATVARLSPGPRWASLQRSLTLCSWTKREGRGVAKDWMGGKREKEGKEDGTGRQEKGNWHPLIRYPV